MAFDKKKWAKENKEKMRKYRQKYKQNNPEKYKEQQRKHDTTNKDRVKERVRQKTNYHNEKTEICLDCEKANKTEFRHLSYEPNIFIEVCRKCHRKRHLEEDLNGN